MSTCERCNGSGFEDSGGVQPWGEPILVECECRLMERNMDESRKQRDEFEKWWEDEGWDKKLSNVQGVMFNRIKTGMFTAWLASRSAIEIKAPRFISSREALAKGYTVDYSNGFGDGMDAYESAILAAGIKVKE